MQRSKNDVWVGLFVLIGLAAVLFLALKSANLLQYSWSKNYTVTAKFDNIGGLKKGAAGNGCRRHDFVDQRYQKWGGDCCDYPRGLSLSLIHI